MDLHSQVTMDSYFFVVPNSSHVPIKEMVELDNFLDGLSTILSFFLGDKGGGPYQPHPYAGPTNDHNRGGQGWGYPPREMHHRNSMPIRPSSSEGRHSFSGLLSNKRMFHSQLMPQKLLYITLFPLSFFQARDTGANDPI